MIELVKVELQNFRSFGNATFTPLGIGQGLTAINGANGMGKSSIVHAIVWAMYGVTPDGVRVGALRRQGSEGEGDVEVKVTFTHAGQTVEIVRALRGKNDTTIASITLDGVEQTNVSSRTASNWITQHIGLDAEAFLTAFVVRQKELDNLVKARPAERRKIIERLAGIERMSKGLELARGEARDAQRLFDSLPESSDPEDLKKEVVDQTSVLAEYEAKLEQAKSAAVKAQELKDDLSDKLDNTRALEADKQTTQHSIDLLDNRLDDMIGQIQQLESRAVATGNEDEVQQELSQVADKKAKAIEQLKASREIQGNIATAETSLQELHKQEGFWRNKVKESEQSILEAHMYASELSGTVTKSTVEKAKQELAEAVSHKGALDNESQRVAKALQTLEEHKHEKLDSKCPTCEQQLTDPDILITSLKSALENNSKLVKDNEETLEKLTLRVDNMQNQLTEVDNATQRAERLEETLQSEKMQLNEVSTNVAEQQTRLEELKEEFKATPSPESLEDEIENLSDNEHKLNKTLEQIQDAKAATEELEDLLAVKSARQAERQVLVEQLQAMPDNALSVDELQEQLTSSSNQAYEAQAEVQKIEFAIANLKTEINRLEESVSAAEKQQEAKQAAAKDLEIKTAAAQSLADFRTDRLARLTPELSEVATDFVARMTEGKYTSVILDDEFTPVLTDSEGQERPVAWLSGGEESAVALALRVAIGEVLAGQRGGLLVLDEVLTAQDPGRRQATMNAVKALPRQIVTINHVSEATDMVDLVANIVSTDGNGSTIEEWAPDSLVGSLDSVGAEDEQ